ncbi:MAG TPA: hypothetical protein DET40_17410 [Lentisphaeria bacterium]|nr:MAG: hypothetical protein A2X45_02590 [Lentisphaerae bacterium GWF2_50_93]HCE45321.1 hypothetical protein [Lentisphaeria bacterium]
MIENVTHNDKILCIIIHSDHSEEGVKFASPDDFNLQMAFMKHKKGGKIAAHRHNSFKREIFGTQEALFIRKGKVRVDFYDEDKKIILNRIINTGDVILLASGSHGFELLEDTEIIEIKQGPYCEGKDKEKF